MPAVLERLQPTSSLRTLAARTPNLTSARRRDPARIRPLQARLIREFKRRYAALIHDVRTSIIDHDCFGLIATPYKILASSIHHELQLRGLAAVPDGAFAFETTPQKIGSFMNWLKEQQTAGILDVHVRAGMGVSAVTPQWSGVYVDSYYQRGLREAYEKSILSARSNLEKAGYGATMAAMQPMSIYMQQPFHVDRVGLIYSRAYEDLKTVTEITDAAVRRTVTEGLTTGLARGMAEGINSEKIGRQLFKDVANKVNQIGLGRAILIARTETARAAHIATVAEYRRANVAGVNVMAEVMTSGLDNVCDLCVDLSTEGPYTLDRIEWLLPAHPLCACTSIPLLKGDVLRPSEVEQSAERRAAPAQSLGTPMAPRAPMEVPPSRLGEDVAARSIEADVAGLAPGPTTSGISTADDFLAQVSKSAEGSMKAEDVAVLGSRQAAQEAQAASKRAWQAVGAEKDQAIIKEARRALMKGVKLPETNPLAGEVNSYVDALIRKKAATATAGTARIPLNKALDLLKLPAGEERVSLRLIGMEKIPQAKKAATFINSVMPKNVLIQDAGIQIRVDASVSRSFHRIENGRSVIGVGKNADARTIVHEIGHAIEHADPVARREAHELFLRRTTGESPIGLREVTGKSYKLEEKCLKDRWIDPYMGRVYASGNTELISMGMELLASNPITLARKDPELFNMLMRALGRVKS